jgi:hypothetical protein
MPKSIVHAQKHGAWKQVKRLIGSRKNAVTSVDPETNLQMNDNSINKFFANLTTNYPHIANESLEMQCPDEDSTNASEIVCSSSC